VPTKPDAICNPVRNVQAAFGQLNGARCAPTKSVSKARAQSAMGPWPGNAANQPRISLGTWHRPPLTVQEENGE